MIIKIKNETMSKYTVPKDFSKSINNVKDAHELRDMLERKFPDAFINWNCHVFSIGDKIQRTLNGSVQNYLVVKTADNKGALLNLKTSTLWKNFSTDNVMAFDSISLKMFMEISNGLKPNLFKKIKK